MKEFKLCWTRPINDFATYYNPKQLWWAAMATISNHKHFKNLVFDTGLSKVQLI